MHWDDLRFFLGVARAGQIGRAARLLAVDATTVGRRLRRLEQTLGQTLFEQGRDALRLTAAGERLVAAAERAEHAIRDVEIGSNAARAPEGVVRVSTAEGFATWFVAPRLGDFADAYPRIQVDLVASTGFLSPSRREADVAITLARPRRGPLVTRRLTDYALGLYASRAYAAAHSPVGAATDVAAHRLVGYVPDVLFAPELDYLREIAPALEPSLRSTSINAQHRLIACGHGIGVLPCFIGDADAALVPLLPTLRIVRSFWLVAHRDTLPVPRVRAFVDWLVDRTAAERTVMTGGT